MTASFAYAHVPVMSSSDFDSNYSSDSYGVYHPTSLPYTTESYVESVYATNLSYATSQPMPAYTEVTSQQDPAYFQNQQLTPMNNIMDLKFRGESPDFLAPPRQSTASESSASVQSAASSAMASPRLPPQYQPDGWPSLYPSLPLPAEQGNFYSQAGMEFGSKMDRLDSFVAINFAQGSPFVDFADVHSIATTTSFLSTPTLAPVHSPAMSVRSAAGLSPFPPQSYPSYSPPSPKTRRQSVSSSLSKRSSHKSNDSLNMDHSSSDLFPICDECGKRFKDLHAHKITHQEDRPEKCPIIGCPYNIKGFARKYDKNRHTLTHFKGSLICGFCPGTGTATEKGFNRTDVFKRHLCTVHNVEQNPPNKSRKSPGSMSGKVMDPSKSGPCSTCSVIFPNVQFFYEHLDECVLKVVQRQDPAEMINLKNLNGIKEDKNVKETLEKHNLPSDDDYVLVDPAEEEDEDEDEDMNDSSNTRKPRAGKGTTKIKTTGGAGTIWQSSSRVSKSSKPRAGLTFSKGGVRNNGTATGGGRKKRKNYPPSWGSAPEKITMKKRVLVVYDGQRRLLKDDMMLNADFEVRMQMPLTGEIDSQMPAGNTYLTDLDVQTLRRADGAYAASEDERGPWVPDNILNVDPIEELLL